VPGLWAERVWLNVGASVFHRDCQLANTGDFVDAGVWFEKRGIDFDQGTLGRMVIGPVVFLCAGAKDFFSKLPATIGIGHDSEALPGIGVGFEIAAETFIGAT